MNNNNRIFHGKLARKYFYSDSQESQSADLSLFNWAKSIKPGDLVNCCDYWNRVVDRVEHTWGTVELDKDYRCGFGIDKWVSEENVTSFPNRIWIETTFYFTDGYQHGTSGGCSCPVWTAEQVREYHPNCDERGCKSNNV